METKEFHNELLGCTFALPKHITVRQMLRHRWALADAPEGSSAYERYFLSLRELCVDWKSEHIPDLQTFDLDSELQGETAVNTIMWACNAVAGHISQAEQVKKK